MVPRSFLGGGGEGGETQGITPGLVSEIGGKVKKETKLICNDVNNYTSVSAETALQNRQIADIAWFLALRLGLKNSPI